METQQELFESHQTKTHEEAVMSALSRINIFKKKPKPSKQPKIESTLEIYPEDSEDEPSQFTPPPAPVKPKIKIKNRKPERSISSLRRQILKTSKKLNKYDNALKSNEETRNKLETEANELEDTIETWKKELMQKEKSDFYISVPDIFTLLFKQDRKLSLDETLNFINSHAEHKSELSNYEPEGDKFTVLMEVTPEGNLLLTLFDEDIHKKSMNVYDAHLKKHANFNSRDVKNHSDFE